MDSKLLHDMFFLGLPLAEKILRPVIVEGDPDVLTDDHDECVARLDQITAQLAALRS
jgi:hypothetical protein